MSWLKSENFETSNLLIFIFERNNLHSDKGLLVNNANGWGNNDEIRIKILNENDKLVGET